MQDDEQARVDQALADVESSDDIAGAGEPQGKRKKRQRERAGHEYATAHGAAEAARDVLHDGALRKEPGAYTVHEARDRAGHVPPLSREPEK